MKSSLPMFSIVPKILYHFYFEVVDLSLLDFENLLQFAILLFQLFHHILKSFLIVREKSILTIAKHILKIRTYICIPICIPIYISKDGWWCNLFYWIFSDYFLEFDRLAIIEEFLLIHFVGIALGEVFLSWEIVACHGKAIYFIYVYFEDGKWKLDELIIGIKNILRFFNFVNLGINLFLKNSIWKNWRTNFL